MAREVNIVVRGIRRKEPDLQRLARALIQLASDAVNDEQREETVSGPDTQEPVQGEAS